jgi:transcriptional regulator with GAF, ATPase, and Fis domain
MMLAVFLLDKSSPLQLSYFMYPISDMRLRPFTIHDYVEDEDPLLSRKKKTRSWLKHKNQSLALLAQISDIFVQEQSLDASFQDLGVLIEEHLHTSAVGIYAIERSGSALFLKASEGERSLFNQHLQWTSFDFETCRIIPTEVGMVTLPELNWEHLPDKCFLHEWEAHAIQTLLHIPLVAHNELYGLLLLASRYTHQSIAACQQKQSIEFIVCDKRDMQQSLNRVCLPLMQKAFVR